LVCASTSGEGPIVRPCVICGSSRLHQVRAAELSRLDEVSFSYAFRPEHSRTFRVVRCQECTHSFCAPLPDADILDRYRDVVDEEYLRHSTSRRLAADAVLRLIARMVPKGKLLDVGCATGDFLASAADADYQPEGLELNAWSAAIAGKRGFVVHQRTLAELAPSHAGSYDVVTLIGVIQYFRDPRAEMNRLAQLLAPGGVLALWTGDASSWLARVLGRRWWYWQGQHVQYFTQASLERLTRDAGLEVVRTERFPFAATYETISNSLRRYPSHRLLSAALRPLFALQPIVYLRLPGEMLFFARKPLAVRSDD
jgi:2-polyprenyl-3-methyl-5-hydroxy-6-metoxy-1,4-benzoquinol methylase